MASAWIGLQSCTPSTPETELEPSARPAPAAAKTPASPETPQAAGSDGSDAARAKAELAALEKVTGTTGRLAADLRDVRAMLKARALEGDGDQKGAVAAWYEALGVAQGRFGKMALDGWLKAYTRQLGKKSDRAVLARLVMAETQGGRHSPYMTFRGLTSDQAIAPLLKTVVPQWLNDEPDETPAVQAPPAESGIPAGDPLLVKAAAHSCAASKADLPPWRAWVDSLPEDVRTYWKGLVAQSCGQAVPALETLRGVLPKLARDRSTQAMAVEAAGRVVALARANDRRNEAADVYRELVDLWAKPGVTAQAMGLDGVALTLRRIDETLWAARYRALVGDYENGKIYAQQALGLVSAAYALKAGLRPHTKEQLASFRAEAYHALAFRIAVENRDYDGALSLTLLGLQSPSLPREWQERLAWHGGLYDYLGGHYESAKQRWDGLLQKTRDDALKAALDFWCAKAAMKLGRKAEAQTYLQALVEDYPVSYYATVATEEAGLADQASWQQVFGEPAALAARLGEKRDLGLQGLRQSRDLGLLLSRAEVLDEARVGDYAKAGVDELEAGMATQLPLESHVGAYVYLSRLQYLAGAYLKSIGTTTKLAHVVKGFWRQYPEQLLVYFPRPYREDYERNAQETSLDTELLLAISRQESGFSPESRSNANAVGIMQLIHATGRRYAQELGMDTSDIDQTLRNPAANIRIGSRYLKFLSLNFKGYKPAIYGGYNAGEYAVELWLKRRGHTDPQMFVELVPFGETKDYIKNVWRNVMVYRYLGPAGDARPALDGP